MKHPIREWFISLYHLFMVIQGIVYDCFNHIRYMLYHFARAWTCSIYPAILMWTFRGGSTHPHRISAMPSGWRILWIVGPWRWTWNLVALLFYVILDIDVPNSHWLVDLIEGCVVIPNYNRWMLIDGIPYRPKPIFTKRTHHWFWKPTTWPCLNVGYLWCSEQIEEAAFFLGPYLSHHTLPYTRYIPWWIW